MIEKIKREGFDRWMKESFGSSTPVTLADMKPVLDYLDRVADAVNAIQAPKPDPDWPDEATRIAAEQPRVLDRWENLNGALTITKIADGKVYFDRFGPRSECIEHWKEFLLTEEPIDRLVSRGPEPVTKTEYRDRQGNLLFVDNYRLKRRFTEGQLVVNDYKRYRVVSDDADGHVVLQLESAPEPVTLKDGDVYREEGFSKSCNVVSDGNVSIISTDFIKRHEGDGTGRTKLFNIIDLADCIRSGGHIVLAGKDEVAPVLTKEEAQAIINKFIFDKNRLSADNKIRAAMDKGGKQ